MGNIFSYLLGEETTAMEASPIFIHLDLNKTILAVDEVKLYGREEVIFLEHWKNEADFLEWAHATHGGDAEAAAWTADLKVSKNEPTLIGYAKEYCNLDAGRKDMMENQLSNVRTDDSTESFWKLVEYLKSPEGLADRKGRECILVFRTFGTDLMKMFNRVDANGHSSSVLKETNANPKIFTMVHEASDAYKAICTPKDLTDGFIQPGNPVPGPKAKGTDEFKERTLQFENTAKAEFAAGGSLMPFLCDLVPEFDEAHNPLAFTSIPKDSLHSIDKLTSVLTTACKGKFGDDKFLMCGIQDNYKPWSRKNWRNGKPLLIDEATVQMFFDDYSFTKSDAEGTYIVAPYDNDMKFIDGDKTSLKAHLGADGDTSGVKSPTIFTAVLNKKGKEDTAVMNPQYFISRVQKNLQSRV